MRKRIPRRVTRQWLDNSGVAAQLHEGVTVEEATPVLFDPYALTHEDRDARNEQRFLALG